jgi:hypothetical protein
MKRLLMVGAFMLASFSTAQALECQREMPKHRHGYWSYRIIDGRTCWYPGRRMVSKSLLHWRTDARPPVPVAKPTNTISVKLANDPDPDACCWPPLDLADSFEARWWGPRFGPVRQP